MRLDPSLNLILKGSIGDWPATLDNTEEAREKEYQAPEERPQGTPFEVVNERIPDTCEGTNRMCGWYMILHQFLDNSDSPSIVEQ